MFPQQTGKTFWIVGLWYALDIYRLPFANYVVAHLECGFFRKIIGDGFLFKKGLKQKMVL